jgi:hypothetical protein
MSNNIIFIPQFEEEYWYVERWNFNHINNDETQHFYCDKRKSYEINDLLFVINRCFKTKEEAEDYYQFLESWIGKSSNSDFFKYPVQKNRNYWVIKYINFDKKHDPSKGPGLTQDALDTFSKICKDMDLFHYKKRQEEFYFKFIKKMTKDIATENSNAKLIIDKSPLCTFDKIPPPDK